MEVNYLTKILRAGVGTTFSEGTRSESDDKLASSEIRLQRPIHPPLPFSPALWDNEADFEDVDEEISVDEHFGDIFHNVNARTMDAQKAGGKEGKEAESGLQEIEEQPEKQKPEVKSVQPQESRRLPTVEVVRQETIRVPGADQFSAPIQPQPRKNKIADLQEEKIQIPSDIAGPEKGDESETPGKAREQAGKEAERELQETEKKPEKQKPEVKSLQSPERDRLSGTDQFSAPIQPRSRKNTIADLQEEKIQIPSNIAGPEKGDESETPGKAREQAGKEAERRPQEIEEMPETQKPEMKNVQPTERDRIPTVEVVKQETIRVPGADQCSPPGSVVQSSEIRTESHRQNDNKQGQQKLNEPIVPKQRKMDKSEVPGKTGEQAGKEVEMGLQESEGNPEVPKPEGKSLQPPENGRLPPVEVVKHEIIRIPRLDQFSAPGSVAQSSEIRTESHQQNDNKQVQHVEESILQMRKSPEQVQPLPRKTIITEPKKEKKDMASDVTKQEEGYTSENFVKSIEIIRKPTGQQNPNTRFFTEPLKKGEAQTARIAKDVASINKKLDKHIREEQSKPSEPVRPVFLPKRPPSRNLGGWSRLERNYIR